MVHEVINLKEKFPMLKNEAKLLTYVQDNSIEIAPDRRRPAIIICPGGSYACLSDREAEPVALEFMARGYQTFIIQNSIAPEKYPHSLLELAAAVACLRDMAEEYHIVEDAITVMGFSAGGHLAASIGTLWNQEFVCQTLNVPAEKVKPNALVLGYPVISSGEFAHVGSFDNLVGDDAELREFLSLENRVGEHTPPTFIWHTFTDDLVPVENTMLFASALRKNKIPFELHIFPNGPHGLSLSNAQTLSAFAPRINAHVEIWAELCGRWLKTMFSICD